MNDLFDSKALANCYAEPIKVCHKQLQRASDDSIFKSICPFCKEGAFLMRRKRDGILRTYDHCILCAQRVEYTDVVPGLHSLAYIFNG